MKSTVEEAVTEIRDAFPDTEVTTTEDGDGGAHVLVNRVPLADFYAQRDTWVGFHITHTYPFSDVYPHFVRHDLRYTNGTSLRNGLSSEHNYQGRKAVQISRKSNHHNPVTDTALLRLHKVLQWLNSPPS